MAHHVDNFLKQLESLERFRNQTVQVKEKIHNLKLELGFLKTFFNFTEQLFLTDGYLKFSSERVRDVVANATSDIQQASVNSLGQRAIYHLVSDVLSKIMVVKRNVRAVYRVVLRLPRPNTFMSDEPVLKSFDSVLQNLQDLLNSKAGCNAILKKQIGALEEKFRFLKIFLWFKEHCFMENEQLKGLLTRVKTVEDKAICFSFFCWVDKMNEKMMDNMNGKLADLLDMINPLTQEIGETGFRYWRLSTSLGSQTSMPVQAVEEFTDFLLEYQPACLKDHKKRVYEGLIYLIKFLIDPPQEFRKDEEFRFSHIKVAAGEAGYLIYSFHVKGITDDMFRHKESVLSHLTEKVKIIMAETCLMKLLRHKPHLKQMGFLLEGMIFLRKSIMDQMKEYLGDGSEDFLEMAEEAETLVSSFTMERLTKDEVVESNFPLLILLQKIKLVKVQVWLMQLLSQKYPVKDQLKSLHEALTSLRIILKDPPYQYPQDGKWILSQIEAVSDEVEVIINKLFVEERTENFVGELKLPHFELLDKIKVIKAEAYLMQQVGHKESPTKHETETVHLGLRILRTFHLSQAKERKKNKENTLSKIEAVISETATLVCSLFENKKDEDMVEEMNCLLQKIKDINGEITNTYDHSLLSSWSNCPRTDGLGFVDSLLRNLQELLKYKTDSISIVKYQIEVIHQDLTSVKNSLGDHLELHCVPSKQDEEKGLLQRVVSLSYQAEYVINSFLVRDGDHGECLWFHLCQFFDIIEKLKLIGKEVEELSDLKRRGGTTDAEATDEKETYPVEEAKNQGKSAVVGLNDEADKIIEKLIRGLPQLCIVSVVGMPGLGKTTLAKKIYDNSNVRSEFHVRAWCYVSERYQKKKMLLNLLHKMSINGEDENSGEDLAQDQGQTDSAHGEDEKSEEDLADDLRKCLLHRRYLIVMDDVWDIEALELVWECLPKDQSNGSRILLTSRYTDILKEDEYNGFTHHLRRLEDDESWMLLQNELCLEENCDAKLLEAGRDIAKSCKGLPLAVTLIAGYLRTKERTEACWSKVARSLASTFAEEDILGQYKNILEHSYKDLPSNLKPCLLYLGTFLEGMEIPVYKLIWLWIAEGFVSRNKPKSSERVAEGYLMDLIRRNLVKSTEERSTGGVKACSVHDILREFCRAKAREENFLQLISEHGKPSNNHDFLHRLCVDSNQEDFIASNTKPSDLRLRSLLFSAARQIYSLRGDDVFFISESFKLLKVLDLGSFTIHGFPSGIENLLLLRFLAIWMDSSHIPHTISKLRDLQIFFLKQSRGEVELPDSFWSMVSLRHVHIRNRVSFGRANSSHAVFSNRDKDPGEASSENTRLDNLQSLSSPCLFHGEHTEKRLKKLPNILKLRCTFMDTWDPVKNCILFPELSFLTELESLKVSYHGSVKDISSQLISSNLRKIFPPNLKKLTLTKFRMPWKYISVIGKLENLEVLKLLFKAFDGQEWQMEKEEFPKLKFLKLDSLNLVKWSASEDYVSNLERLVLKDCKQLQMIPSCLENAENLKMIEVQGCTSAVSQSVEDIKDEQLQDNNEIKVSINNQLRD